MAHFGYRNPNQQQIVAPLVNRFEPSSANGQQPTSFAPGSHDDVFQVPSSGTALTWSLTGNEVTATRAATSCPSSITVIKVLNPATDAGRFDLEIGGEAAGHGTAVGDGGSTGAVAVAAGTHVVGESAASGTGTDLARYDIRIHCANGGSTVADATGASVKVDVGDGDAVVCTITNTRKGSKAVRPILECVVVNGSGVPDLAVWGYENPNPFAVDIPVGGTNGFSPAPEDRGQPREFQPGRWVGVFQTPLQGAQTLTWTVGGATAATGASSPHCTPTVELRKVTEPADDPGVFNLRVNERVLATGGNGTTTGPVTVGVGEGTVSETAAPGTNLADYDTQVECTRNGQTALSVTGTKADGAIANGDVVVCTFTNRRKQGPTPPTPGPPSAPLVDLIVAKTGSPSSVFVGQNITWTIKVANASVVEAADVNLVKVSERSYRARVLSVTPSQGSCTKASCNLGRLAPGASATITVVTRATRVGEILNVVHVGSEEAESNYLNNTAAALVRVTGEVAGESVSFVRDAACHTLGAAPRVMYRGATSVVLATALNRFGKPVRGLQVRARGPVINQTARTNARGIARFVITPSHAGIVYFGRTNGVTGPRCRTRLGVLGAVHTQVTG